MVDIEKCFEKLRQHKNTKISVTGSCGKTTTCKMIYDLLKTKYEVDITHKNSNGLPGIPWCINNFFNVNSKFWIFELGIDGINQMEELIKMIKPNVRIITNIYEAHTESFKNFQEYKNEKLKMLDTVQKNDVVIINNDDVSLSKYKFKRNIKVIYCGSQNTDDIQLTNYKLNNDGISSTISVRIKNDIINFKLNGIGRHNAINCCLAIGCAVYFNISKNFIIDALNKFEFYENRGSITSAPKYTLYDYTYNLVGEACRNNLKSFYNVVSCNKLIILGFAHLILINLAVLNYATSITKNIIVYTKCDRPSGYDNVIFLNNFDDIIEQIKILMRKGKLHIFIQSNNNLQMYDFVKILKIKFQHQ